MQVTLPAKGKIGSNNYREKKLYSLSEKQVLALSQEFFTNEEETVDVLGKQAKQVMSSLVKLELFKTKRDGSFVRTRLGSELLELVAARV